MIILDGKKLSEKILKNLKTKIRRLPKKIRLAVILVGDDSTSLSYIFQKEKTAKHLGVNFRLYKFPVTTNKELLKIKIKKIARGRVNNGVIIQLPLHKKFQEQEFLNLIPAKKDVDVLGEEALGKFYAGTSLILPPTPSGILRLLEEYKIKIASRNVVIIGRGKLVGKPLAFLMMEKCAAISVVSRSTKSLSYFTKKADILISGAGSPNLIKARHIKKGAVVIDAGFTKKRNKILGDVDFKSVSKKAGYITPVPGGVGPMTVAMLFSNLLRLVLKPKGKG